jgi:uncharacterized protein YjbI with pentapeptide repeats
VKDAIRKIIELRDAGKVSAEDATELIAALAEREGRPPPPRHPPPFPGPGFDPHSFEAVGESLRNAVGQVVSSSLAGLFPRGSLSNLFRQSEAFRHGAGERGVCLSKFVEPTGEDFVFRDNQIAVSAVFGIELVRAAMTENSINASRVGPVRVSDGKLTQCAVNGSSLTDLLLDGSSLDALTLEGTKCARLELSDQSIIHDSGFAGCSLKDVRLGSASGIDDCKFSGCSLSDVDLVASRLNDGHMSAAALAGVRVENSRWHDFSIQGYRIKNTRFVETTFYDIAFGRSGFAREAAMVDSEFVNCKFHDCRLDGCSFNRVTIRNVDLSDLELDGVELSDRTIDGSEEFLRLVRAEH